MRKNIEDIYELSPMQQGMFFHTLYTPASGVYVTQLTLRLSGTLNGQAFKEAWQQVVARHPVLRTFFVWEGGEKPLQIVRRKVSLPWIEHDWRGVPEQEQEQQLKTLLMNDREQGFSLQDAPLMRCFLIQLDSETYEFVLSCHHLLLDGWSLPLILKEVWAFYPTSLGKGDAAEQGRRLYLRSPRPYGDYIVWLKQQDLGQAEAYWRQALQRFIAPTPLVVDRARVNDQKTYSEHHIYLSSKTSAALQKLARDNRLTLNTIMQGAWALLLSRYNGEEEVLFGATVSGRPAALRGVEQMVGLFINTLPVRVKVPTDVPLLDWLSDLQKQQVEREEYAYSPLVDIQGWSEIPRGTALFESLLVYENYPMSKDGWKVGSGLQITGFGAVEQSNYPLTLVAALVQSDLPFSPLSSDGARLRLAFSYDTSRFEQETIQRMAGHLKTLLEGIVGVASKPLAAQPPLARLPLLTECEKRRLLVEWNAAPPQSPPILGGVGTEAGQLTSPLELGGTEGGQQPCIHQLFQQQVQRTPEAIAVVCGEVQLTYHDLNRRANQLAHHLIELGVGQSSGTSHVGLYVERGIGMVVGVLAILKAGGAYVPIDSAYPSERIRFMLHDSSVSVLLTEEHLLAQLEGAAPPQHWEGGPHCICLGRDEQLIRQQADSNPLTDVRAYQLAYIIYTSGSSGHPKGVMVSHANVTRLFAATQSYYHFDERDVWTLFHSIAFDFSVWEVWGALLYGGRLVVVPYMVSRSPDAFYELLCQQQVTVLNQTPSAFRALMAAEERVGVSPDLALRLVIFGGEALELASLRPWFARHGSTPQLVNMYGITEMTVHVTYRPLTEADLDNTASYIGTPIPDLDLYILDQHLQPVPIGVPGELCVGGAGVSQGYKGRPELTNERFIDNPFGTGKLYRSGDLARYILSADANLRDIEYLGRIDHQVKIRGFRIELGEIEALLAQHESVREAVVILREEDASAYASKQLVAYLVGSQPIEHSTLRSHLGQSLPDYMIPSLFVQLETMPLTHNGKIDRSALPAPHASELPEPAEGSVAGARTPTEQTLVTIWQKALGIKQIGIHDDFFEIGGHSLLATEVMLSISETFNVSLPLQHLFEMPTIAALAGRIDSLLKRKRNRVEELDQDEDDRDVGEI